MGNSYAGRLNGQTFSADLVSANYIKEPFFGASTLLTKGGGYA